MKPDSLKTSGMSVSDRYMLLRKRLDALGYLEPLAQDNLALVERLFGDLVKTTDSLRTAKDRASVVDSISNGSDVRTDDADSGFGATTEAYKFESARLHKENSELHKQLLEMEDKLASCGKELKEKLRRLEHENQDLKFLNNQYIFQLKSIEQESAAKTAKLQKLQEKNMQAIVHIPGDKSKTIGFRRQRMDIDSFFGRAHCVKGSGSSESTGQRTVSAECQMTLESQLNDPYVADMLKAADMECQQLRERCSELNGQVDALGCTVDELQTQIGSRDQEIKRLSQLVDGGRSHELIAMDARNRANERVLSHLNIQIDYLQRKNADLERRLEAALATNEAARSEKTGLDLHNRRLEDELQKAGEMTRRVEFDRSLVMEQADRELSLAKTELNRSRSELEDLDVEVCELRKTCDLLRQENAALRLEVDDKDGRLGRLELLLDRLRDERQTLSGRVDKLTSHEKELVLELERVRKLAGPRAYAANKKRPSSAPTRTDILVRGLEKERDYWRTECDALQKLVRSAGQDQPAAKSSPSSSSTAGASPLRRGQKSPASTPTKRSQSMAPAVKGKRCLSHDRRARSRSPASSSAKPTTRRNGSAAGRDAVLTASTVVDTQSALVDALTEERDYYKRKYQRAIQSTESKESSSNCRDAELRRVEQERDELQSMLRRFESQMDDIQRNVKHLSRERDRLSRLYEDAQRQLDATLRSEVAASAVAATRAASPPRAPPSPVSQSQLRRLRRECDDLKHDLRQCEQDRDGFRDKLQVVTEKSISERARLDSRLQDLESLLRATEHERDDLLTKSDATQRQMERLESQLRDATDRLGQLSDDCVAQRSQSSQMRLLAEQNERTLEDAQKRLALREDDLHAVQVRLGEANGKIDELERARRVDKDELNRLRNTVESLDREKDNQQQVLDEKTEKLLVAEENLIRRTNEIKELQHDTAELSRRAAELERLVDERQHEVKSLRRQLDSQTHSFNQMAKARDAALSENKSLHDELSTMTREHQSVSKDLEEMLCERDELKAQIQEYVMEVKRVEDLLAEKEEERRRLLENYRTLTLEAEKFESHTHQLESQSSGLRIELVAREDDVRRLQQKIDTLESSLRDHIHSEQNYELQLSNLTRSVAGLEETLRQCEDEKHSLLRDLQAVRDLCSKLEATRDNLQRQLTTKALDVDKLQSLSDDLKHEVDQLRSQMAAERSSVKNLESLLKSNREKEFQGTLAVQEKDAELQLLRDRLHLAEQKLEDVQREAHVCRQRNNELEADLERMRRNLNSEQFERERLQTELRRRPYSPQRPSPSRSPDRSRGTSRLDREGSFS